MRFGIDRFARALQTWDPDDRWFPACLGMAGTSLYVGLFLWAFFVPPSFEMAIIGAGLAGGAVGLWVLRRSRELDWEDEQNMRLLERSRGLFGTCEKSQSNSSAKSVSPINQP